MTDEDTTRLVSALHEQADRTCAALKSHEQMLDAITADGDGNPLSTWMDEHQREQTAATILAALIAKGRGIDSQHRPETMREAVALADALRAALKEAP